MGKINMWTPKEFESLLQQKQLEVMNLTVQEAKSKLKAAEYREEAERLALESTRSNVGKARQNGLLTS
jgi:hypothetical protein